MSQNVEIVRQIYAAWDLSVPRSLNQSSVRGPFGFMDPDIDWCGLPDGAGAVHRGGCDKVLVLAREAGRGKGSGAQVERI